MNTKFRKYITLAALTALAGCATTGGGDPRDPIEPLNRVVFEFNDKVDIYALKPIAQGYNAVLPQPVRTGIRNFFANLRDPWIGVNNLLQGKIDWALSDMFRFIANSTFGIAGVFDIASDMGMEKHNEDFGQTLGRWGVESGPFLVLPILGPSTLRDGLGLVVDSYGYLPWHGPDWLNVDHDVAWRNALTALDTINVRAGLLESSDLLAQAALDRYTFARDAYIQRRRNLVYDGKPPPESSLQGGVPYARHPGPMREFSETERFLEVVDTLPESTIFATDAR
jgi:phospholipid-binding lipoprotein MlaA